MNDPLIRQRKSEHLRIVTEGEAAHLRGSLLDCVELIHCALPELALSDIDTSAEFFGKRLALPLMITSMTGGAEHAAKLNRDLASVASEAGIAFSVGSQKVMLEHPETYKDFNVRAQIPDGVLLGNIGASLLTRRPLGDIADLARAIEADGLCVHLNPAQELAQAEGDRDFRGVLSAIFALNEELEGRVLVKETGAGLSPDVCALLFAGGIRYVDVSGAGGTSWTKVELQRESNFALRATGEALAEWGIPTAASLIAARAIAPSAAGIVASGGIETGLDCARAIAAGADIAGFARGILLTYANGGIEAAARYIDALAGSLKAIMLLCAAPDLAALRSARRIYRGELKDWLSGFGVLPDGVGR